MKSGIRQVLFEGPGIEDTARAVLSLLDGTRTAAQVLDGLAVAVRDRAAQLLDALAARRFFDGAPRSEARQAFAANFGAAPQPALASVEDATVAVLGRTFAARSLVLGLLELGVGRVLLVDLPHLGNPELPPWPAGGWGAGTGDPGRVEVLTDLPDEKRLAGFSLLCATHDFGPPDALLDINRLALRLGLPFLPLWLFEMIGHVGPLTHPFETACLRCYLLRADSNNPRHQVAAAVRGHLAADPSAARSTGLLPPMAGVLGEIATLEAAKLLNGFAPADTIARQIETNLVSFQSAVRRILKVPRCPDCSEVSRHSPRVLTLGPQIPQSDVAVTRT